MTAALPPEAADVVQAYLHLADREAPGLIEGLYLVGSVALGEFRPHTSDVDFLAVTSKPLDGTALRALDRTHRRLRRHRSRPTFDGHYVTWADLRDDPDRAAAGPTAHEGRFRPTATGRDPVAWHTLAQCGIPCRGPAVADLDVWTDPDSLRRWVLDNLDGYWGRLRRAGGRPVTPHGMMSLTDYGVVWYVTGLSRIHYTVVTGAITGKEGGARHALGTFASRWERIVDESLRIRGRTHRRSLYGNPFTRRRDLMAFWDMLHDDARRRAGPGPRR